MLSEWLAQNLFVLLNLLVLDILFIVRMSTCKKRNVWEVILIGMIFSHQPPLLLVEFFSPCDLETSCLNQQYKGEREACEVR